MNFLDKKKKEILHNMTKNITIQKNKELANEIAAGICATEGVSDEKFTYLLKLALRDINEYDLSKNPTLLKSTPLHQINTDDDNNINCPNCQQQTAVILFANNRRGDEASPPVLHCKSCGYIKKILGK
jgi:DNA-directed RNA polymerase subunit M/transcription elongation factor TFIIS